MYDDTGTGWARHMLGGTSMLLGAIPPEGYKTKSVRDFLLEVRNFEIFRAMLFAEHSFLAQPTWQDYSQGLWSEQFANEWTPKESLLDLMTVISDLCVR